MGGVLEGALTRPDGRAVGWTEYGPPDGTPLLRMPGTPGCRWSIRSDRTPWDDRSLRVITVERPGFGLSTRLPGRGFAQPADDTAAVLDHLGVERVRVVGGSGGAPHVLSFCGRHPDRVAAATVMVGIAPVLAEEVCDLIGVNQAGWQLVADGDRGGLEALLARIREEMLADPLAGFRAAMAGAPADDHQVMNDPDWQTAFVRATREALAQGVEGWADEVEAVDGPWNDVVPSEVRTSLTWYHAAADRNCPLRAAERLVSTLPNARLVRWPDDVGHLHGYRLEGAILDELMARG